MPRFVLAGKTDCPGFAQAEMLADKVSVSMPNFEVRKLIMVGDVYDTWLGDVCQPRGWNHTTSPLIYRVGNSEAGTYIGGAPEFASMIQEWYGVTAPMDDEEVSNVVEANMATAALSLSISESEPRPIHVCITSAGCQIAYTLLYDMLAGNAFGPHQEIVLHLLDIPDMLPKIRGVVMEIEDSALPLYAGSVVTANALEALANVDYAVIISSIPRKNVTRQEHLKANTQLFRSFGAALSKVGKADMKVICYANPASTNALVCSRFASNIPVENFTTVTMLDRNRCVTSIADRINSGVDDLSLKVSVNQVKHVAIWGNRGDPGTLITDASKSHVVNHGAIAGPDQATPVSAIIRDPEFFRTGLHDSAAQRGAVVRKKRSIPAAMSAAKGICDHLLALSCGTPEGEFVCMGVSTNGNPYGIAEDLIYSMPIVTDGNGAWRHLTDYDVSPELRQQIRAVSDILREQREFSFQVLGLAVPSPPAANGAGAADDTGVDAEMAPESDPPAAPAAEAEAGKDMVLAQ